MEMTMVVMLQNGAAEVTIPESALIQAARNTYARMAENGSSAMSENAFARAVLEAVSDPIVGDAMEVRGIRPLPVND